LALRDFNNLPYLPLLTVRPAEMRALEELPDRDKDRLLPSFLLRPWGASHHLQSSIDRLFDAYGDRPAIIDLADHDPPGAQRPVHAQLAVLREQTDGFANWCDYVEQHRHFIPTLQLGNNLDEIELQARRLVDLGRGLVVRFPRAAFVASQLYARRLADITDGGEDVIFILDYEKSNAGLLIQEAQAVGFARNVRAALPAVRVAFSASSFPESFDGPDNQEIYERQFFNGVREILGAAQLIYSDRGSARAERQQAGGGVIYPRIDYAQPVRWRFFRAPDEQNRAAVYRRLANGVIGSPIWDAGLRLWGTQMIERTALGDPEAITSPARATATRINIHLHQQLFYDNPGAGYDTDEEWTD
jgi:hypothetical protein